MEKVDESNCSSPMATISTPTPRISEKPVSPTPYPSDYLWSELERYLLLLCLGKKKQRTKTNQRVLKKWAAGLVVEGDACLLLTLMKFPFVSIPTSYIYIYFSYLCVLLFNDLQPF